MRRNILHCWQHQWLDRPVVLLSGSIKLWPERVAWGMVWWHGRDYLSYKMWPARRLTDKDMALLLVERPP